MITPTPPPSPDETPTSAQAIARFIDGTAYLDSCGLGCYVSERDGTLLSLTYINGWGKEYTITVELDEKGGAE